MIAREWKPGDVAAVDSWRGKGQIAFRCERILNEPTWCVLDGTDARGLDDSEITAARPLVVIDPEDREQVSRLVKALSSGQPVIGLDPTNRELVDAAWVSHTQAALREFANPTPPKPAEPTGDGAVVEDANGYRWVRIARQGETHDSPPWRHRGHTARRWEQVTAVRVLSEGVQP